MGTDQPASWGDVVAALDRTDHRSVFRIAGHLSTAAQHHAVAVAEAGPLDRRRIAAVVLRDALAAYRLAGGTVEHLAAVVSLARTIGYSDDVAGCVRDRAAVARQRVDLEAGQRKLTDPAAYPALVERLDKRAAVLERPRDLESPTDAARAYHADELVELVITTPGEHAAAHDRHT